jgi:BASS family bile acid:Na+ symporter
MELDNIVNAGIPAVVIFLMMLVGLRLEIDAFRRVGETPGLVAAALVAQPLLLPPVALGAAWLAGAGPLTTAALVLIAACPPGVLSNVYTVVAGGNAALSVTLTAAGTLLSVLTLPLTTAVGFALIPGAEATVSVPLSRTATDLVLSILVPVGLGMSARRSVVGRPRLERALQATGALATVALVGTLLASQWGTVTGDLARLSLAVVTFSVVAFLAGTGLARTLATTRGNRVAVALELPGRNLGVAAVVGVHSLGLPEIAGLATAVFIVQVPVMLAASLALHRHHPRPALATRPS